LELFHFFLSGEKFRVPSTSAFLSLLATLKAAQATGVVNLELAPALFSIKKVRFVLY
jgi:hypothetical protein